MKIIEWLAANLALLAIGLVAGTCGIAVILFLQAIDLPRDWWPYAVIPATLATIAGAIYGARGVLWLVDRIGNRDHYRRHVGK